MRRPISPMLAFTMGSKKRKLPQTTGYLPYIAAPPQLAATENVFTDRARNFEWDERVRGEAAELQEHMTDNPRVLEERYYIGYPYERLQELSLALSKVVDKDDFLFGDMPSIDVSRIQLHYNRECAGNDQQLQDYQVDYTERPLQFLQVQNVDYQRKEISADDIKDFIDSRQQLVLEEGQAVSELEVYTIAFENALKLLQNQSNTGQLTELLNSIKNYYINKVTRKGQRMKALELANQELDGKVISLQNDQMQLRADLQAKDQALNDAYEQNKQLNDRIFELFAEKNKLSKTLEELQQRLGQQERSSHLLKTENEELAQQQQQLNQRIKHITAVSYRLRQVSDQSLEKLHISEQKLQEGTSELLKMQARQKAQEAQLANYMQQNYDLLNYLNAERAEFEQQRVQYIYKLYKYGEAPDQFDYKVNYNLKEAIQTAVVLTSDDASNALRKLNVAPTGLHSLRVVLQTLNAAGNAQELLRAFQGSYVDVLQTYSKEVYTVGWSSKQAQNSTAGQAQSCVGGYPAHSQALYSGYKRQQRTPRGRLTPRGAENCENQLKTELSNASGINELSEVVFDAVGSPKNGYAANENLNLPIPSNAANTQRFYPVYTLLAFQKPQQQKSPTLHKLAPATQSKAEISEAQGSPHGYVAGERAQSPDSCGDAVAENARQRRPSEHAKRDSVLQCDSARKSRSAASTSDRQVGSPRIVNPSPAAELTASGTKRKAKTPKSPRKQEKLLRHNSLSSEQMQQCQSMPRLEVLELRDGVYYLSYTAQRSYQQRMQKAGILVNKQMYYNAQLQIAKPAAVVAEKLKLGVNYGYTAAQKQLVTYERRCETADFGAQVSVQTGELTILRFRVNELTRRCQDAGLLLPEDDIYKDADYGIYLRGTASKSYLFKPQLQPQLSTTRLASSELARAADQQKASGVGQQLEVNSKPAAAGVNIAADAGAEFYASSLSQSSFSGSSLSIPSFYHAEAANYNLLKYVKNTATDKAVYSSIYYYNSETQTERDIGELIEFAWDQPEQDPADLAAFSVARQLAQGSRQEREIEVFRAPNVAVAEDGLKLVETPLLGGFQRVEGEFKAGGNASSAVYGSYNQASRSVSPGADFYTYWGSRRAGGTQAADYNAQNSEMAPSSTQQLEIRDEADVPTFDEFFAAAERRPGFPQVSARNSVLQALRRQRQLAALQDELQLQSAHFYLGIQGGAESQAYYASYYTGISQYKLYNQAPTSADALQRKRSAQTSRLKATATAYVRADAQKCGLERPLIQLKTNMPTISDFYAQLTFFYTGATITVAAAVQPSFMLLHPRASAEIIYQLSFCGAYRPESWKTGRETGNSSTKQAIEGEIQVNQASGRSNLRNCVNEGPNRGKRPQVQFNYAYQASESFKKSYNPQQRSKSGYNAFYVTESGHNAPQRPGSRYNLPQQLESAQTHSHYAEFSYGDSSPPERAYANPGNYSDLAGAAALIDPASAANPASLTDPANPADPVNPADQITTINPASAELAKRQRNASSYSFQPSYPSYSLQFSQASYFSYPSYPPYHLYPPQPPPFAPPAPADFPAPHSAEAFRIPHALDRVYFKFAPGRDGYYLVVFPPCVVAGALDELFAPHSAALAAARAQFYSEIAAVGLKISIRGGGAGGGTYGTYGSYRNYGIYGPQNPQNNCSCSRYNSAKPAPPLAPGINRPAGYLRLSALRGETRNYNIMYNSQLPGILARLQSLARAPLAVFYLAYYAYVQIPLINVTIKPLAALIRLIRRLLQAHARATVAEVQLYYYLPSRTAQFGPKTVPIAAPGELYRAQAENLAEFVYYYARRRYGVSVLVEAFLWGLAANLAHYYYENEEVYLFARFFFDELDADHFLLFYALRGCLGLPVQQRTGYCGGITDDGAGRGSCVVSHNSTSYQNDNSAPDDQIPPAPELVLVALLPALVQTLLRAWEPPRQRALLQSIYAAIYNQARSARRPPAVVAFPLLAALVLSAYDGYRRTCYSAVQFVYYKIAREEATFPGLAFSGFQYLIETVLPSTGARLAAEMFYAFSSAVDAPETAARGDSGITAGTTDGITVGITAGITAGITTKTATEIVSGDAVEAQNGTQHGAQAGDFGSNLPKTAPAAAQASWYQIMSLEQFQDLFRSFQFARFARVPPDALDGLAGLPLKRLVRNLVLVFNNYQTVEQSALALRRAPARGLSDDGDARGRLARLKSAVQEDLLAYDLDSAARNFAALVLEVETSCLDGRPECALCMLGGAVNGLKAFVSAERPFPGE